MANELGETKEKVFVACGRLVLFVLQFSADDGSLYSVKLSAESISPNLQAAAPHDWDAKVWAPLGEDGFLAFKVIVPEVLVAQERSWRRDAVAELRAFISTFCALSASADLTLYQKVVVDGLRGTEPEVLDANMVFSWAVIIGGLSSFAGILTERLGNPDGEMVSVPVSPMHIWAICEAARAFVVCIDPECDLPVYYQSAISLMDFCGEQNRGVTDLVHPYAHIAVETCPEP